MVSVITDNRADLPHWRPDDVAKPRIFEMRPQREDLISSGKLEAAQTKIPGCVRDLERLVELDSSLRVLFEREGTRQRCAELLLQFFDIKKSKRSVILLARNG